MLLKKNSLPILTAEEAVAFIEDGDTVAFSGFTPAGSAKVVPRALAKRALEEHTRGRRYKLRVLTGASTGYEIDEFSPPDEQSRRIARHVVEFLLDEKRAGRIPPEFLPLQAGVGNVANAVIGAIGEHPGIPPFKMYSEVYQDAMADLMEADKLLAASATSLTLTPDRLQRITENLDFFAQRIILRPQEISNHPGIIRRLGVIAMNTALEIDIYGNVNSSHLFGMDIMNGIGGSGEFTRNSYLSIFMTPSIAKDGKISKIVPMCPHIDNNEHSVQVVVTEQGLADLRGLGPMQRARLIIDKCAHPLYREYLQRYIKEARPGHIRHDLTRCFELHRNLMEHGSMLPD